MASGTTSNAGGCGALLALAGLVVVIAYCQFFLLVAVVVGAVLLVASLVRQQALRRLRLIAAAAHRRFAGNVFRFGDRYGVIQAIKLAADALGFHQGIESASMMSRREKTREQSSHLFLSGSRCRS